MQAAPVKLPVFLQWWTALSSISGLSISCRCIRTMVIPIPTQIKSWSNLHFFIHQLLDSSVPSNGKHFNPVEEFRSPLYCYRIYVSNSLSPRSPIYRSAPAHHHGHGRETLPPDAEVEESMVAKAEAEPAKNLHHTATASRRAGRKNIFSDMKPTRRRRRVQYHSGTVSWYIGAGARPQECEACTGGGAHQFEEKLASCMAPRCHRATCHPDQLHCLSLSLLWAASPLFRDCSLLKVTSSLTIRTGPVVSWTFFESLRTILSKKNI